MYQLNLKTRKWAKAICRGACPARQRMASCGAAAKGDANSLVLLGGMRGGSTLHDMHVLSLSGSYELGWTRPDCGHKVRALEATFAQESNAPAPAAVRARPTLLPPLTRYSATHPNPPAPISRPPSPPVRVTGRRRPPSRVCICQESRST